jgi:hypothetical protein
VNVMRRNCRLFQQNRPRTDIAKRKAASRRPSQISVCRVQATACAFRFLRQPSRLMPPMPVAKRGKAAGSGVALDSVLMVAMTFGP